jgi:TetR/AcrR family transcriptional regulator, transcriptional repressor for nem operon
MRCSPAHKARTKLTILHSAQRLFAVKGYAATSIDEVMRGCGLTRGGFYAYFRSKSQLYREAMRMVPERDASQRAHDREEWLQALLDAHLRVDSPLAFFATDVASRDRQVRAAYTDSVNAMSRRILERVRRDAPCEEDAALALAAMVVGAAAIARSTDDVSLKDRVAAACRSSAVTLLDPRGQSPAFNYFWSAREEAATHE